jgi:hypothetical protein
MDQVGRMDAGTMYPRKVRTPQGSMPGNTRKRVNVWNRATESIPLPVWVSKGEKVV